MDFNYVSDDERNALYDEVWSEPVITVAKRYNLSDNGLRKRCQKLRIPVPSSGYWAKVRAGQNPPRTPLPKVTGELRRYVHNYVIKYRSDLKELTDEELLSNKELYLFTEQTKEYILDRCSKIQIKSQLRNPHRLIEKHKEGIKDRKKIKNEPPKKQILGNGTYYIVSSGNQNTSILPIEVSKENLNRTYRIVDELIKAIEDFEGYVATYTRDGYDIGYFTLLRQVDFRFTIKEKNTKTKVLQKNKIVITIYPESKFYNNKHEALVYEDEKDNPVENQLQKIMYQLIVLAEQIYAGDIVKEREAKRAEQEGQRLRYLEKMRQGQLEEIKLLEQASSDWNRAEKIRAFVSAIEDSIIQLPENEKKEKYIKWSKWAKNKADWIDPLMEINDELLGKSKTIFEDIDKLDM